MRPQFSVAVALATGMTLISACSANNSHIPETGDAPQALSKVANVRPLPKSANAGWLSPEAKHGALLYVGEFNNPDYDVLIYKLGGKRPKFVGRLTDGIFEPEALWVDKNGTLYVATFNPGDLVIFPPGQTSPSQDIFVCPSGSCGATGLSVTTDSTGLIYFGTSVESSFGGIYEFEPGSSNPIRVITDDPFPEGLAADGADNLYASTRGSDVLKYAPGGTSGSPLGLHGLTSTGQIAFDKAGDLVVADYVNQTTTYNFFKPGATTAFRKLKTIAGFDQLAFDKQGNLYSPVPGTSSNNGSVELFPKARNKGRHQIIKHVFSASGIAIGPLTP